MLKKFIIELWAIYKWLFNLLFPFIVIAIPIIIGVIYDQNKYMILLIISIPVGLLLAKKYWNPFND
jgi:hypothetical protein